jgi:hypothetical protein
LAQQEIKNIVLKDTDENVIGMKPSDKQYQKLTDVLFAFNDLILAAGDDQDKIAKIASPDAVRELVERVYPSDQRDVDYMSRGAAINVNGVIIPPTVAGDERSQTAYKNIVALPPSIPDKNGKVNAIPRENWQRAIEILRQTGNVAAFEKNFPGKNGMKILKALPYQTPPPGNTPPVIQPVEDTSGFWSTLGARLFPPPGETAKSLQFDTSKTPIGDAVKQGLNVVSPLPAEAKK